MKGARTLKKVAYLGWMIEMGKTKITQYSFSAGEIAPSLAARIDIGKYSIALAKLKNGFVHIAGGVSNRAGLEFVCEIKDSSKPTRVIPFVFNTEQTYIIEAGEGYFRYIQNGGLIVDNTTTVETATSFLSSHLFDLKHAQTADILTLCSQEYFPKELSRNSNTDWTIEDIIIEPSISSPTNVSASKTGTSSSSTKIYRYKITAIKKETYEESIPSIASNDVSASAEGGWVIGEKITIKWDEVEGAVEYNIYKEVNGVYTYAGVTGSTSFDDVNIDPDLTTCIPIYKNPFSPSIAVDMTANDKPLGYKVVASSEKSTNEGFKACDGDKNTYWEATTSSATLHITLPKAKLATSVKIETSSNPPSAFSFYGSNDDGETKTILYTHNEILSADTEYEYKFEDNKTSFKILGIEIKELASGSVGQLKKLDFQEKGNFPACVNYFQQQRHFANTKNNPNTIYSSQKALFNNFNTQRPLIATNAVTTKLYDGKMNEIKDLVSADDLVVLAADAEWRVNGADGVFQATPLPVAKKQSSWGSSDLSPIYSGDMILFVSSGKNKIRDLEYQYAFDKYKGNDLTYLANHLFKGKQIVDWAYSKEPDSIVWCVMSDGTLNALTYNPEQQILGWHHHETDGKFESVAVIREGYEDVPYFVIARNINAQYKRYIERMKSRIIDNAKDGFFVDCGLSYHAYNSTKDNLLTLSSLTGSITLNSTSPIFTPSFVGNTINAIDKSGNIIGQAKITAYASELEVSATVEKDFSASTFDGGMWGICVDTLKGLEHLEGKEVIILADAGVIEGRKVVNGSVSLGTVAGVKTEAAQITVGLPYEFEMKTLNFEGESTQGSHKIVSTVNVKVDESREDFTIIGIDGKAVDLEERSIESINDAGHLTSGDLTYHPRAEARTGAYVHIKQAMPLPITVLSVTPSVEITE